MSKIGISRYNKSNKEVVPAEFLGKALKINSQLHRITPEMIASCVPTQNDVLDFSHFVYAFDIPPAYCENVYYLIPEPGQESNYAFILQQLSNYDVIGITEATFRNLSTIFGLSCFSNLLVLYKLRFDSQFIRIDSPLLPESITLAADYTEKFDAFLSDHILSFDISAYKDMFTENLKNVMLSG